MSENGSTATLPELPEQPKGKGKAIGITAGVVVLALAAGFGIKALSSGGDDNDLKTVKVGTTEQSDPYWTQLVKVGKEKYGLNIQPTNFTDYTQANPALSQSQIDLNQFQHLQFLANYNVENKDTLKPIGSTYIVPLSLYSKKHTKLNEFAKGGKIAIPNDPTNQARALLLLQSAGLLSLKGGGNSLSTPADIDTAKSKVGVTPMDAAQTASALPSVEGSVVNNNYAADAKLDPSKSLFKDDPKAKTSEPYINVIAARAKDVDNATFQKFVEAYHDKSVQDLITQRTKGTSVEVKRPASELQSILKTLEDQIKAKK